MNLEVIDDVAELVHLHDQWTELVDKIPTSSPFHSPEWLITWWQHFGSGGLHVITFRTDRLVGLVPCFLHEWAGRRQLTLIGSGISDYLEPPILSEYRTAVIESLSQHLDEWTEWEVLNWQDLSADSAFRSMAADCGLSLESDAPCSLVSLTGSFEAYWLARPGHLRQNTRRDRAKAESKVSMVFEVVEDANDELLGSILDLHTARWKTHGLPGMVEANHSKEFLMEAGTALGERDMLRIAMLRIDDEIGAAVVLLKRKTKLYNYLTAFDPAYAELGLGRSLLFECFRYAYAHGYTAWDFLRGEEPYKKWWGAEIMAKCRLVGTRTT